MVKVYRFRKYDVSSDEMQTSRRMATREVIERVVQGEVIKESELDVDQSMLGEEIPGMTARGFGPHSLQPVGFQRTVR